MTTLEIHEYLRDAGPRQLCYFPFQVAADTSDLAAVLLYDLQRRVNGQKKKLIRDHLQWTYDTHKTFAADHPYASEPGVRKAFLALEKAGLIRIEKSGKYNGKGYDGKWWYHVSSAGMKMSRMWLMRFDPQVAAALDIPKAVILQNFRHHFYQESVGAYVTLDPKSFRIPYHPRTIERHLEKLVEDGILERNPDNENEYRVPGEAPEQSDWRQQKEPITVAPTKLLPALKPGEIGLLVGHSGTGQTSVASFAAVQLALAGANVIYATLEEPLGDIVNRMYAQEFGVSYSDLHRGSGEAIAAVQSGMNTPTERTLRLREHLKFVDLSGRFSQTHELVDAIWHL